MTTEQKAKAYDNALERAKSIYYDNQASADSEITCENIFPELKESEKIRKVLVNYFKDYKTKEEIGIKSFFGIPTNDIIAWLEKQGEQKPADNVEPKFKVGDWITDGYICGQITSIEDNYPCYKIREIRGAVNASIPFSLQDNYHLWTIADAKDGDVLVYGDNPSDHHLRIIMLFKSMRTFNSAFNHFHIFDDEFKINDWCDCNKTAHPATKEQKDLLFQKMKEAGYEWDSEKKELKKIEPVDKPNIKKPKFNEGDWIVDNDVFKSQK